MLIFAVGIASMTTNVGKYTIQALAEIINSTAPPGQPQLQTSDDIVREVERLRRAPLQSSAVQSERRIEAGEPVEQNRDAPPVQATRTQAMLTLIYQQRQHRVDQRTQDEIKAFLTESPDARAARVFEIRAAATPVSGSLSEARRLAYYRAMIMRGELIRNGITADRVVVRVDEQVREAEPESVRVFARP